MKENAKNSEKHSHSLKPLAAALALGESPTLKEPRLLGHWVLWLEQRPDEGGRTTALIRPWDGSQDLIQELTPAPINLRSRVHSYGGGSLASHCDGDEFLLAWIDDSDGCLWTQSWEGVSSRNRNNQNGLVAMNIATCLSRPDNHALADGLIDIFRKRWIGVMEKDGRDFLVAYSLNQEHQSPCVIYSPTDFVGYSALSPDGAELAWVEWQHPSMPWEASQLYWGCFNHSGNIQERKLLAGSNSEELKSISVFQPMWLPNGQLLVAEDTSGWWNLMITGPKIDYESSISWRRLWSMKGETAMPQWVYGMSTISVAGEKIVVLRCEEGSWRINLLSSEGLITEFDQPFDDLAGLFAEKERVVAIAGSPLKEPGLLELDLNLGSWRHTPARKEVLQEDQISVPEPFWFEGFEGKLTHAWYYPPNNSTGKPGPLLVKSHSGPTGMAGKGLNLAIQFWTSRGWGVVDVNYGGSTGFGRAYRERLKGRWGVVDVFDCSAAAKFLVALGKADSELIAIEGGSAGGFTTLSCLCFTDVFRAAACRYAVSDLVSMAQETHRFEQGYFDYLLGPWPDYRQTYIDRSPLIHSGRINCPVIFA